MRDTGKTWPTDGAAAGVVAFANAQYQSARRVPMRLWEGCYRRSVGFAVRALQKLRMPEARSAAIDQHDARRDEARREVAGIQPVACYEASLRESKGRFLQTLRRTWRLRVRRMVQELLGVSFGYGASSISGIDNRENGQRWSIRAVELPVGDQVRAAPQSSRFIELITDTRSADGALT